MVGQPRCTQRYEPQPRDQETKLVARMLALVARQPRYGYRRIWALLRQEGWRVNRKRIWRLWKQQGLKVPRKKRKKRRLGCSANGLLRQRATHRNHVWTWDFIFDATANGRSLKWLSIVDEFTRECLELEVSRTMTALDVIDILAQLVRTRGVPAYIRSDNGPEFIATALQRWLGRCGIATLYVEPGSPWENGFAESFHARLRDELLAVEIFDTLAQARLLARQWRLEYNHQRPHSSLGYSTPAAFAASQAEPPVGAAPLPTAQPATITPGLS